LPQQTLTPLYSGAQAPGQAVSPVPSQNQADRAGAVSGPADAKLVLDAHRTGIRLRRERDLLSEKLLLHIDGSGDFQWADIFKGSVVEIPRSVSEFRKTENVLRLIVDNAVAHHVTMPLRYFVEAPSDRRSREKALVDTVWANYLAQVQDLNGLFAEALYLAMSAGFCPVHRYWRDGVGPDWFEPIGYGEMAPGTIDCFVGNPFGHVFDVVGRRGFVRWSSYERTLPADQVRQAFGHMPGVSEIQGSTKIPSAALFQRIARSWTSSGLGTHGSPVISGRNGEGEELLTVICRETAPGVLEDPRWRKSGRLQIIAVPGEADSRRGDTSGHAISLADQELPAGEFSWSNFWSHHRGDDIHGKPWVEDLDQLQVDLNIALSKRWEAVNRMVDAPIVAPGGAISEDMMDIGGYQLLEVEPSLAAWRPRVMEWPQGVVPALDGQIKEIRSAMYTMGGYQAASRGEAPGSRMAYRAILALQQADNTVHGPVNMRFRRSACDFMRGCWRQMKKYGDVPWLVEMLGDEHGYLAEPYIDNARLSDSPPHYKLVNAFGSSPELRAQEVLELMQIRGADGQPFLSTEDARRQYPNQLVFDTAGDPKAVQQRRARTISTQIHVMASRFREETGFDETQMPAQWRQQALDQAGHQIAFGVFGPGGELVREGIEQLYPRLRDDDLAAHLSALSEVTQDETADPLARRAARYRQDLYFEWQAMGAGGPQAGTGPSTGGPQADPRFPGQRQIAAEMQAGGQGPTSMDAVEGGQETMIAATAR